MSVVVTLTHAAQTAQWRSIQKLALTSYLAGSFLFCRLSLFDAQVAPLAELVAEPRGGMALLTAWLVTTTLLALGAYFSVPLPAAMLLLLSLPLALRAAGRAAPLALPLRIAGVQAAVVLAVAVLSVLVAGLVRRGLTSTQSDPLTACLRALPYWFCWLVPVNIVLLLLMRGTLSAIVGAREPHYVLMTVLGLALFALLTVAVLLWSRVLVVNRTKRLVFDRYPQHVLEYAPRPGAEDLYAAMGRDSPTPSTHSGASACSQSEASLARARAEESFTWLLITALALAACLQGALDASFIYCMHQLWCSAAGHCSRYGVSMVVVLILMAGAVLLSGRIARRIKEVVPVTGALAAATELAIFAPILVGSSLGWPLSTLVSRAAALLIAARTMERPVRWPLALRGVAVLLLAPVGAALLSALLVLLLGLLLDHVWAIAPAAGVRPVL